MKNSVQLTTTQFVKMHKVNKRTLHYYEISQSIEEIKLYLKKPNPNKFIKIAKTKEEEIDN